jgi:ribonuclease D
MRYVDSPQALEALCGDLAGHPWLALDTEFIREDTYYPKLCLLQVATPEITACVDPLALPRLDPLIELLFAANVTKVFHACHQDMEIFYHLTGRLPQPIFDTQIAAPLLGLPYQASYAALVQETLGVTLVKAHARTDWRRRPLSAEQLEYAADDVRYLGRMYLELHRRLLQRGRLDWPAGDFAAAADVGRYLNPPEEAWRRIRGARKLSGARAALARALAEWRETVARREDKPRGWIVPDEALLDLARLAPTEVRQLSQLRTLRRHTVARHGAALVAVIRETLGRSPPGPADEAPLPLTADQEQTLEAMQAFVRLKAAEHDVHPNAIASRSDLAELVRGRADSGLLAGWRRDLVGLELQRLTRARHETPPV